MATVAGLENLYPATGMPDADWWNALWPRPDAVVAALGMTAATNSVDLCCGDGLFTVAMAALASRVVAVDLDPAMLAAARARTEADGLTNCEFVAGDAYAVADLVRERADFVLMANTFHGVPDKPRLARAVARILAPDGRFAVVNWHRRPREETTVLGQPRGPKTEMRMTPADLADTIAPAGLELAQVVELAPYHYGAVFKRRHGDGHY
jgi:ubiquinone/menaquinone biosynthesis C-methylase UbiE